MCERCERREERDKAFWQSLRRALLMVAKAIETRYTEREKRQNAA